MNRKLVRAATATATVLCATALASTSVQAANVSRSASPHRAAVGRQAAAGISVLVVAQEQDTTDGSYQLRVTPEWGGGSVDSCGVDFGDGTVVADPSCQAVLHTYAHPGSYPVAVSVTSLQGQTFSASRTEIVADTLSMVGPTRILDTRSGLGAARSAVGSNSAVQLQVDGVAGIPATGVTSVLLNVTATGSAGAGYVTAYAGGAAVPGVSEIQYANGETVSDMVSVPVGANGKVTLLNRGSAVQLVADVVGYEHPGDNDSGDLLTPAPERQIFTTVGWGRLGPGQFVGADFPEGSGYVPQYALLRVTAFGGTMASYLTAQTAESDKAPAVSTVNFAAGQTISNLAVVPLQNVHGYLNLYNHAGWTDVRVDELGYFTNDADAGHFVTVQPTRLLDTRATGATLKPGGVLRVKVAGVDGIPADATAVTVNLTATDTTAAGYFTAYADGAARPGTSDVDFGARQTTAAQSVVPVGADGYIDVYNHSGDADLIVDLQGYYLGSS